jgi:hypothetical protein
MDPPDEAPAWLATNLDIIEPGCASSYLPIHLTPIGHLPTELLLQIGSYLRNHDVAMLARVSPRFCAIAKTRLYSELDGNFNMFPNTAKVYSTLLSRPDLATMTTRASFFTLLPKRLTINVPMGAGTLPQAMVPASAPRSRQNGGAV